MEKDDNTERPINSSDYPQGREFLSILGHNVAYMRRLDIHGLGETWWVFNERGEPMGGFEYKANAYFYMHNSDLHLMTVH